MTLHQWLQQRWWTMFDLALPCTSDVDRVRQLVRDGRSHHVAGRYLQAAILYLRALAIDENDPGALHLAGVASSQLGQHTVAIDFITQAIARRHAEPAFHNNLGTVMLALDRWSEAGRCYSTAIALDAGHALAWRNLNALRARQAA
jgi:tetratricopeptide (TPR) repeat protein